MTIRSRCRWQRAAWRHTARKRAARRPFSDHRGLAAHAAGNPENGAAV